MSKDKFYWCNEPGAVNGTTCTCDPPEDKQLIARSHDVEFIAIGVPHAPKERGVYVTLELWPGDEILIRGYDDPSKIKVRSVNAGFPADVIWSALNAEDIPSTTSEYLARLRDEYDARREAGESTEDIEQLMERLSAWRMP